MTMLEAIKAARIAFNKLYVSCDCEADKEYDAGADAFTAAESEAKREAEAFERAREALSAIEQMIRGGTKWRESDILAIIDAYFATGEKEG